MRSLLRLTLEQDLLWALGTWVITSVPSWPHDFGQVTHLLRASISAEWCWSLESFSSSIQLWYPPFPCTLISRLLMKGFVLQACRLVVGRRVIGQWDTYHWFNLIGIFSCLSDWFNRHTEWVGGQLFWINMPLTPSGLGVRLNASKSYFTYDGSPLNVWF